MWQKKEKVFVSFEGNVYLCKVLDEDFSMRATKYTIICILTVLAIVGCGRGAGDEGLTHDEVVAINERVLEVATASGFSVRRTFSRLFKEKFGLTPTEFREAARAEAKLV
jgi:AraC-like DNA-binding protein